MTAPFLSVPVFYYPGAPSGNLYTYIANTTTPQVTYSDAAGTVPNTNPVILDTTGAAIVRLGAGLAYDFVLKLQDNTTVEWTANNYIQPLYLASLTQTVLGGIIYPATNAENNTSVTITAPWYPVGNLLRYGIVPNSSGAAASNSTILQTLFNPSVSSGPTGLFTFPNAGGADSYSFSGVIPIRPGVTLDLGGCTINYSGTGVSADANSGLFFALQDFECRNGNFVSTYNMGVATSCGAVLNIGARGSDSARWPVAVWDSLLATPQGDIRLKNLRITMNLSGSIDTSAGAIYLTGGLQGVLLENIYINGSGTLRQGIAQEFGWATNDTQASARQSSHMHNFLFKNIQITNMENTSNQSNGIVLAGAYQGTIENYSFSGVSNGLTSTTGESLFYRPWSTVDDITGKRLITLRNITGRNCSAACLALSGSQARSAGTGYLQRQWLALTAYGIRETVINGGNMYVVTSGGTSGNTGGPTGTTTSTEGSVTWAYVPLTANTDQIDYCVDGFSLNPNSTGDGIDSSAGYISIRNGTIQGGNNPIFFFAESTRFDIEGVRAFGGQQSGFEMASAAGAIWSPTRLKKGSIRDCYVYGNSVSSAGGFHGIHLNFTDSVLVENNYLNQDSAYNGVADTTQGCGVLISTTAFGVICRANHVGTVIGGGNTAYQSLAAGGTLNNNDIQNPQGNITQSGPWNSNSVANATGAALGSKTSNVNTVGKFFGRLCINITNSRLLTCAGPANTDIWSYCDGNAPGSITPS